jgi:hypothetical protein
MGDELEKEEGKGFKVQDRRRFTEEGEARKEGGDDEQETVAASGGKESQPAAHREPGATDTELRDLPPINFSTFIISLSTQALMLLGEISDPETGVAQKDVAVAKQTIDIIAMLDEKCRGNLDDSEERLLKEVLYNLRMRYVEVVRQK